ncbi:MAG: hypothetical protein R3E79_50665 [Caldilineaceae bacterium]
MTRLLRAACCVLREPLTQHPTPNTQHAARNPRLLFIAYGNTLRRDDGAGLVLAEKVLPLLCNQGFQVELVAVQQLTPELALTIADPNLTAVYFFDTAADPHPPAIQIHEIGSTQTAPVLGHHLIPSALLLYAKRLYAVCPPAWLVTIPGHDFALGEGFSVTTASHLADVGPLAQQLVQITTQVDRL